LLYIVLRINKGYNNLSEEEEWGS